MFILNAKFNKYFETNKIKSKIILKKILLIINDFFTNFEKNEKFKKKKLNIFFVANN